MKGYRSMLGHRRLGVTERNTEYDPQYLEEVSEGIETFTGQRF
jgi:hypothetical protein